MVHPILGLMELALSRLASKGSCDEHETHCQTFVAWQAPLDDRMMLGNGIRAGIMACIYGLLVH